MRREDVERDLAPLTASAAVDAGGEEFASFYQRELAPQVRRAALMVGSSELANDLVHDAFTELYRRWGTVTNPGAYLSRSVLNGCRDVGRRRASQARFLHRLADTASQVEPDVLGDVLQSLPFHQRAAVVLRFYNGLSTAEIAEQLDCAPGSVGPWIDRALQAMRRALR